MKNQKSCPNYQDLDSLEITKDVYNKILCPNLRVGVRMGLLDSDKDGWVQTDQLKDYLTFLGVKERSQLLKFLIGQGELITSSVGSGRINLSGFIGSGLDHGSSSGILNNERGFDLQRLELLKSFAVEGDKLYKKQFSKAVKHFHSNGGGKKSKKGAVIQALELSSLLDIYGRTNESGDKYLTVDDVDDLWREARFPEGWLPPKLGFYGNFRAAWNTVSTAARAVVGL